MLGSFTLRCQVALIAVVLMATVTANPNGSPVCPLGTAATIFHTVDEGELSAYSIDATVDGIIISPTEPVTLSTDSTYVIEVGPRVNGILIRLGAPTGQDVTGALSTDDPLLQLCEACVAPEAIGISHVINQLKGFVTVTLDTTGLLGEFDLDITVVNIVSAHVHSGFKIVVSPAASPTSQPVAITDAPTVSPTLAPDVTDAPTVSPTLAPDVTDAPTVSPTLAPDVTDAPTVSPTLAPDVETDAPTVAPTLAPDVDTDAPTVFPVAAPIVEPPTPKSRRRPRAQPRRSPHVRSRPR